MAVTLSLFAGVGAQFFDNSGNLLSGGKIFSYRAGTTTLLETYTSNTGAVNHTNPIILDAAGRVPGGEIWLTNGVGYKFLVYTSADVLVATYDNVPSSAQPPAANDADSIQYEQGYTATAGGFVTGDTYRIVTVGTTDFTLIGAASNTPGLHFIATGPGSGTGTAELSRTIESKLRDTVSVLDYGADPSGVTDSAASFQASVDANFGKQILVPAGTYLINSTVTISTVGLGDISVPNFVGDGMYQTIINNQTGGAAFQVDSGTSAEFAYGFGLEHLSIISIGTDAGTIGVQLDGCRFATLNNVRIDGMASHGVYALSSVGDFTDTSSIEIRQCQIENCGGYGVYAAVTGNAIQYSWNMYECRVGSNSLGGVLWESMVNASMAYCGVYYNNGFGLRITSGSGGAPVPKQVHIDHCEFDTNDGVQIDLVGTSGVLITTPYLIANPGVAQVYTKGINVDANCVSTVIEQAAPRWDLSLSGLIGMEFASGSTDSVARDTIYAGYSALVGTMYVDNSNGQLTIDDKDNRIRSEQGTWTVQFKDESGNTSATTVTGYYTVNGSLVTASFRDLDAIDTTGLTGSDFAQISLPFQCALINTDFIGSSVMTSVTGIPFPAVGNSATNAYIIKAGGTKLLVSDFTSGVSNIDVFTLAYQRA